MSTTAVKDLLKVEGLRAGYFGRPVVFDLNLRVSEGEIVTILGHNGAGKSTTLRSLFGLIKPFGGTVTYAGRDLSRMAHVDVVKQKMSFVPSERFVFGELSVMDNLRLGGLTEPDQSLREQRLQNIYELFPILKKRLSQKAGTMSGGEQRMLSLGLSLMTGPRLMLLDEPSLGLAPVLVQTMMDTLKSLVTRTGMSVLLVEQNVAQSLRIADRVYVMRLGRIILEESAERMRERGVWWDLF